MYLTMSDALRLLGIENPSGRSNFNIACPACSSGREKKLNINLSKDVFCCPKCSSGGGVVAFYAFMKHGIDPDAIKNNPDLKLKILDEMKGGVPDYGNDVARKPKRKEKVSIEARMASIKKRDRLYNEFLDSLVLDKEDMENLLSRGLTESEIVKNGYKSVNNDFSFQNIPDFNPLGVPGFYKENNAWKIRNYGAGFYIPVRDLNGRIQGCQIRLRSGKLRYLWLSSPELESGVGAETWSHFVGVPEETVMITEGPLKADIIYRFTKQPVIAVPGVSCLSHMEKMLISLKKVGVSKVLTCFDMDYKTNENVRKAYLKLISIIKDCGMSPKRLIWDENFKGYDDYLLHIHQQKSDL